MKFRPAISLAYNKSKSSLTDYELFTFQTVNVNQVEVMAKKVLWSLCSKSLTTILPTLTSLINMSLIDGTMPKALKVAAVSPPTQEKGWRVSSLRLKICV